VSDQDIDVVRKQFAACNERDWGRAMDLYANDVVLTASAEAGPNPGIYEGKEAVGEWFGDWFRAFDRDYRFEIEEARELEDGLVFLFATHSGHGRLSGAAVHGRNGYLYRVRDGKIVRVGFFATGEDALDASSLPEWSQPQTH